MTVTKEGAETVVALAGELDVYTAASLRERLIDLLHGTQTSLVVDLAMLNFIDSTGLGTLVGALHRVQQAGGEMVLRRPTDAARTSIALSGLSRVLPIRD